MSTLIRQHVLFDDVTAAVLFETYVDSTRHGAAIGSPARMSRFAGDEFAVFGDDRVRGRNLAVVAPRMIVQSWRGSVWHPTDPDSVLVLTFLDGAIDLLQAGVPAHCQEVIAAGWHEMYWVPWRAYFGVTPTGSVGVRHRG